MSVALKVVEINSVKRDGQCKNIVSLHELLRITLIGVHAAHEYANMIPLRLTT